MSRCDQCGRPARYRGEDGRVCNRESNGEQVMQELKPRLATTDILLAIAIGLLFGFIIGKLLS